MRIMRSFILLLMPFLMIMIGGCQIQGQPLARLKPEDGSPFKITFSYPSNWKWEVNPDSNRNFSSMTALNPYPAKESASMPSSRLAGLMVDAYPRSHANMQERVDSFIESTNSLAWLELLNDETLKIDNHFARRITVKKNPSPGGESQTFICEYVYLPTGDRYYQIFGCFLESEVNGRFYTEFKAMVESIQILP